MSKMSRHVLSSQMLLANCKNEEISLVEVERELKQFTDVNIQDDDGNTCLHYIAYTLKNNLEIYKLLLKRTRVPFVKNNSGKTPLDIFDFGEIK